MNRTDALETILRLLPSAPGSDVASARERLKSLSSSELERMADYLLSLREQRPKTNLRRTKWEVAQADVQGLASIRPLLVEWNELNLHARDWLTQMRRTPSGINAIPPDQFDSEKAILPHWPTSPRAADHENHDWHASLDSARKRIKSGGLSDVELESVAYNLNVSATDAEFDRRITAVRALRAEIISAIGSSDLSFASAQATLFQILPWDWFRNRITNLRRKYEHEADAVFTNHDRVLLAKFLAELRSETAPHISLSDAKRDPSELSVFVGLVNTLWRAPIQLIPRDIDADLIVLFDLGGELLEAAAKDAANRAQYSFLSQAMMRAYLMIAPINDRMGRGSQASNAADLVQSLLAAERAGFLSTRTSFLEPSMITRLEQCASRIGSDPNEYLNACLDEVKGLRRKPLKPFNVLLNAADILRFRAHVLWRIQANRLQVEEKLDHAQSYFDCASELATDEAALRLFVTRAVRARLLRAAVRRGAGLSQSASTVALETVSWIDKVGQNQIESSDALRYLKCCALVEAARGSSITQELDGSISEQLRALIVKNPTRPGAWNLLIDYISNVKGDQETAADLLTIWKTDVVSTDKVNRGLAEYLDYRKARLFLEIAAADESKTEDAIGRYIELLFEQPGNGPALSDLVELAGKARPDTIARVRPLVGEKFADTLTLTWERAVIRSMFGCAPARQSQDELVQSFCGLLATDSDATESIERMGRLLKGGAFSALVVLELASKFYFWRGRQERNSSDFIVADRLLQAGLAADPEDVVWISRRIDIALEQRSLTHASELLTGAVESRPDDPILKFQLGRLQMAKGELKSAESVLRQLLPKNATIEDGIAIDFHPAVVDQLALVELRQGQFDEAESFYRINLQRQPLDPRGRIGIGRVQFERGRDFWPFALQNWGEALLLQADSSQSSTGRLAKQTAALIAGLFRERADDDGVMAALDELIDRKPEVISLLAPALASKNVSNKMAFKIIAAASDVDDHVVHRRVAQFLRSRTIWSVATRKFDGLQSETEAFLEWCRNAGVLSDYFAGAKGTYARTLVRQSNNPIEEIRRISDFPASWKVLADHIAVDGYVPGYYSTSEELVAQMSDAPISALASFATVMVSHVWETLKVNRRKVENLLDVMRPEISLLSPIDMGLLDKTNPPRVSALVDEDILRVANQFMNGEGWRDAGAEIHRSVKLNPTDEQAFQFARGGIFFRGQTSVSKGGGTAYLSVVPAGSRSTYELEALENND